MSQTRDEEAAPLLTDESDDTPQTGPTTARQRTPLPWRQLSLLLLLRVSESLTSEATAPFFPQLIKDIDVTDGKDSRVGYYVGLLQSLLFFIEACTAFFWNRLSDQVGRKPVILIGLVALSGSMWILGVSKTLWSLIVSRCLNGALNHTSGVIRSMMIEITDSTNIARAYGVLPITSAIGTTVGPLVGGTLVNPAKRFPGIFGGSEFLKEYPYFLPCAIPAAFSALVTVIAFVYVKETKKPQKSLGQWLFGWAIKGHKSKPDFDAQVVLPDDEPGATKSQLPLHALLIRPVLIATASYATLSLTSTAFRAVMPVVYSMPIELGGLGLDPPTIGTIMSLYGVSHGIIQCMLFAPVYDWLGPKAMFLVAISFFFPMIFMFPVMNAVARIYGLGYFVWCLVGIQKLSFVLSGFAYEVIFIYIGASSPNKGSIGATNGFALMVGSFLRAFGPAIVNSALSYGAEKKVLGGNLAYLVLIAMVGLTLWMGSLLPKRLKL